MTLYSQGAPVELRVAAIQYQTFVSYYRHYYFGFVARCRQLYQQGRACASGHTTGGNRYLVSRLRAVYLYEPPEGRQIAVVVGAHQKQRPRCRAVYFDKRVIVVGRHGTARVDAYAVYCKPARGHYARRRFQMLY